MHVKQPENPKIKAEYADLQLRDMKIRGTMGVGGFGRVELVQHKTRPELVFALKYMKKADIVYQGQKDHVINERNIQMSCDSRFIVSLYRTFQDRKYLYLLQETCLGGDLFGHLQRQKNHCFDEKQARFYAGCVLEALAYLHERDYIYRDLKPENLLVDTAGYLKLTDFGFAKKMTVDKAHTFAGTPEYVAPEIVLQKGHDKAVDYWAYGIFIYELLVGRTPFKNSDDSHMTTYNLIIAGIDKVTFPQRVNKTAQNLIKKLCRPSGIQRLGCQKNGVEGIREHRWFLGFKWNELRAGAMKAPWVPKPKSNVDLKNFDSFRKDTDTPPDDNSDWEEF